MIARKSIGIALAISLLMVFGCGKKEMLKEIVSEKDGATMLLIPAGEFRMGSPEDEGKPNEHPQNTVFLDAFYIDKYEVTNFLYKKFMDATGYEAPRYWNDWYCLDQPVGGVSWHDAVVYAKWAGKRLPTEAEWEKAARGTDGRKWPWGNEWDSSKCNSGGGRGGRSPYEYSAPVGSFPAGASPYGVMDMAGSVFEWCADWCSEDYYSRSPKRNPKGPDFGSMRVTRGASCRYVYPPTLRCAARYGESPDSQEDYIGFRCVQDVTP